MLASKLNKARELVFLPRVGVNLMLAQARDNHPFYAQVVEDFLRDAKRPHPKLPLMARFRHGVALCILPPSFDEYYANLEGAARRNHKKALRSGWEFRPIDLRDHLEDIAAIRASAPVRQGPMPASYLRGEVKIKVNPPSLSPLHAYPSFGVIKDGRLGAYCEVLVAGEIALIQHILGHAQLQPAGVVPLLIMETVRHLMTAHPQVRHLAYGSFFGASAEMQRFKQKFGLAPHRVRWCAGEPCPGASQGRALYQETSPIPSEGDVQLVYRQDLARGRMVRIKKGVEVWYLGNAAQGLLAWPQLRAQYGAQGAARALAKLATKRRGLYLVVEEGRVLSTGWVTAGLCRYYAIEPDAVVIGPIATNPEARNRGLASLGLTAALNEARYLCAGAAYIDTSLSNTPAQKVFAKCGFGPAVHAFPRPPQGL